MVLETEPIQFLAWFWPALLFFFQAAAVLGVAALVGGYLLAAFRYGPLGGGDVTYHMLKRAATDLVSQSPRRIMALAWLAIQESLRRRVLVGFGVFLIILLFAGWFLDTKTNDPATLYLSFVLTATTYLILLMALVLSTFSLPADIKNHTIYTVVTKPVRPGEIVLGRILGFSAIGTLLLAVMGLFSYFFVIRVLNHTHEVEIASLAVASGANDGAQTGRTSNVQNHRHQVTLDSDGNGSTDIVQGHYHEVDAKTLGDKTTYVVSPPRDLLTARVPAYGKLRFRDRNGKGRDRGINVGNEWKYRSYIDGGTLAAAIWTFENITPERFPKGLPIEMTIRVFRSYKGDIEKGILGSLVLRNPRTGRSSQIQTFEAKDFLIDHRDIPRKLVDPAGKSIDLFDDLVSDGELEIHLQCLDDSQYFGMAQADVYLRARDASFTLAGEVADGAISWVTPPAYLRDVALPAMRAAAAKAGRETPILVAHIPVCVHEDRAHVVAAVREQLGNYPRQPFYAAMFAASGFPEAREGAWSEKMVDAVVFSGNEAQVLGRIRDVLSFATELIVTPIGAGPDRQVSVDRTLRLLAAHGW